MLTQRFTQHTAWIALAAGSMIACSGGDQDKAFANPVHANTAAAQGSLPDAFSQKAALRLTLAPTGNSARYRVRERLVGHDLPNDAIGETTSLTGGISFDSAGRVIRQVSRFTVDAATFVSDKERRDGFVRGRLLQATQYPSVVLVPTEVRGVSLPLRPPAAAPSNCSETSPFVASLVPPPGREPPSFRREGFPDLPPLPSPSTTCRWNSLVCRCSSASPILST